jgi:hypothetical protein
MDARFLVATVALAALAPRPARAEPPAPTALRDSLLARGKAPIYFTYGEAGVAASDGTWSASLVEGAVEGAALDAAQDLVWLVRGGRLEVLDLREAEPKPVPIVERWYIHTDGYASHPTIEVTGVSTASTDNTYAGVYPSLTWAAKPKIVTAEGAYGGIWEDQDAAAKKAIRKAKIVGGKWLKEQQARKARTAPARPEPKKPANVTLPEGMGNCEDQELCGDAQPFGRTGWLLVVVEHTCGDACHTACVLFDPKTKRFASPAAPATWGKSAESGSCLGYVFDDSGTRYLAGDQACTAKGCSSVGKGAGFGWLGGGKP